MTGTLDRVTDFALNLSAQEMPDTAKEAAALMMLDTMGILIASGPMETGVIARDTAALLYASNDAAFGVPTMLHDGSGWGAMVGLSSAILAERGFIGAPAITIEDADVASFWGDLGQFWQVEHQYVKPYPICRWAHAAIDGVRTVMMENDLAHDQIRSIHINSFQEAACLYAGMPDTTSQAQYSLPFAVAVQAIHGRIGVEHISGAGLSDPAVAKLVSRIHVLEDARHSARFPQGRWADVTLKSTDGRVFESGDTHARGGPEAPLSTGDVIAKYTEFAAPVVGSDRADAIRAAILGWVEPTSRLSDLMPLVFEP